MLWIGTVGGGNRFDPKTNQAERIGADILSSDRIKGSSLILANVCG